MVGHDTLREFRDFIEEFGIRATAVWAQLADPARGLGNLPGAHAPPPSAVATA